MNEVLKAAQALTTEDLDRLIYELGELRATRTPPVPAKAHIGKVHTTNDPRYYTEAEQMTGGALLGLRHNGFGWLWFVLPSAERDRLIGYLEDQRRTAGSGHQAPPGSALN